MKEESSSGYATVCNTKTKLYFCFMKTNLFTFNFYKNLLKYLN